MARITKFITETVKRIQRYWSIKKNRNRLITGLSIAYIAIIGIYLVSHQVFFSPDQFFIFAFIFVLFTGRAVQFLWDWTPMLVLILSYEYLRGLIPLVSHHVHFYLMIRFDSFLFHTIPTVWLQNRLFDPYQLHWYDYFSVVIYFMHFTIPLIFGFYFWLQDRPYFKEFVIGIVILSYLTFFTYFVFPAAPPWMAAQAGLIPPVTHITDIVASHFLHTVSLPTVYAYFGANLTAAVPSLHAAYPTLTGIFIIRKWPKALPLVILYLIGIWFAIIYLGEHYFFDEVVGITYGIISYYAARFVSRYFAKRSARKKAIAEKALQPV